MTTRLVRACGGKSHSWLTPTSSRSKPRAKRISVAEGIETGEVGGPVGDDLVGRDAGLELAGGFGVADEEQQLFRVEFVGIQLFEDGRDFESHAHGAHR